MKAELINPFIVATLSVLETSASVESSPLTPYIKKESVAKGDVSGVIDLTGQFNASVSISFTSQCILKIVSTMFGEEMTQMNEDVNDAVGELSNMIAGQVTTNISGLGESLKAVFSKVLTDEGHTITHIVEKPVLALPFETGSGSFTIEVCFKP